MTSASWFLMEDYKKTTLASYKENALELAKKFEKLTDVKKRYEFGRFIELVPGNKILDLGSGSGDHALYFSQQGLDVTCIDLSPEMIKLCKEKDLKAFVMDIENLEFEANSFNGIWAVTSLIHIPKSKILKVLEKINIILKEKGIFYVCVKEGKGEEFVTDKDNPNTKRFFSYWTEDELKNIFGKYFDFIELKKAQLGHTTFLNAFFRKKDGRAK